MALDYELISNRLHSAANQSANQYFKQQRHQLIDPSKNISTQSVESMGGPQQRQAVNPSRCNKKKSNDK